MHRSILSIAATVALGTAAANTFAVGITLTNPSFYGQPNSTSQTWADYGAAAGPNAPTATGLTAGTANYFDRTAATDGAFIIPGSDPSRGRIYSFSGVVSPEIDVPLTSLGAPGYSTIVLQAMVTGNPIDNSSFLASTGGATFTPSNIAVTTQTASGSQGPTTEYDYVVTWTLLPAATQYALTYAASSTSSSQSVSRVDTFSQTPEPTALGAVALGSTLLMRRRRSV